MKLNHSKLRLLWAGAVLLGCCATFSTRADYQSTVLSQGPVGYWRLSETVRPVAPPILATNIGTVGVAGNGDYLDAVRGALPGAIVSEPANPAVFFPAAVDGNRVQIPWAAEWNPTTAFSVEFWAKPGQTNGIGCPAASVEFIPDPIARNGWLFYQGNSTLGNGNGFMFRQYNTSGSTALNTAAVNLALDTAQWYHVVGVYDGATIKIYVNGVLGQSTTVTAPARANNNTGIPLTFGARALGTSGFYSYNGSIDEAATYTTALSADRVLAHYQAGTNASPTTPYRQVVLSDAPAGYWRFAEPSDPPADNLGSLGNAADGQYNWNAVPGQAGPRPPTFPGFDAGNNAVSLDGQLGSVSVPALNLNANTVTITCWVNPNGFQRGRAGIVHSRSGSTAAGLIIDSAGGRDLSYDWEGDPTAYNSVSSVTLQDGQWNFAALVIRPDSATIFVPNGTSYSTFTNFMPHAPQPFDGTLYIGTDPAVTNFNGLIDEVAIFNRSLSLGEAYSQYAAAMGNLAPLIFWQPQTTPLYRGDTLALSVDAGGSGTLSYQWYRNGAPITGATQSTYTKANVQTSDAGNYTVTITGSVAPPATSDAVAVAIDPPITPVIAEAPVSRTIYQGGDISLRVVAAGGELAYQWSTNGTAVAGATNATFVISNATTNNTGTYAVTVSNSAGSTSSTPATITVLGPTRGYESIILADAPHAWWRLNESDGTVMFDSMGRHDGYFTNLVTFGAAGAVSGNPNKAVTFSGNLGWAEVPFSPELNTAEFTIECWVKTSSTGANMSPLSTFKPRYGFFWELQSSGSWRGCDGYGASDDFNNRVATASGANTPGQWVHLAATYGANGHTLYFNGQWDGNGPWADFYRNTSAPFRIGAVFGAGDGDLYFNGEVDEVVVYQTEMSAAQIEAHYTAAKFGDSAPPVFTAQPVSTTVVAGTPGASVSFSGLAEGSQPITYQWLSNGAPVPGATSPTLTLSGTLDYVNAASYQLVAMNAAGTNTSVTATLSVMPPAPAFVNATNGLVLHLTFDNTYADSSGRNNNGTAQGTPSFVAGRIGSGALHYATEVSGTTVSSASYVSLGTPADLQFGTDVDFSVAYWVRMPSAGYLSGDLPFLCSAANSYGNPGITFAPSYNAGGWSFSLNGAAQTYGAANSINNGQWHHLLHSFSRAGNAITYLDGVQVDSRSMATAGNLTSTAVFNIGQDPTGLYAEAGAADVDDMAVWRRALTPYDAYAVYYVATNSNQSFDTYGPVSVSSRKAGNDIEIIWQAGTLLEASSPTATNWTPVAGARAPYIKITPPATGSKFYKVQL